MLSLSATLVRRVVYMKPVPAVDTRRAITTLMHRGTKFSQQIWAICGFTSDTNAAYRAFDFTAILYNGFSKTQMVDRIKIGEIARRSFSQILAGLHQPGSRPEIRNFRILITYTLYNNS